MWLALSLAFASEPLATVDGVPITPADVAALLESIDPAARAQIDEERVVDELVVRQLLSVEADKRKLAESAEGKAAVARATREALSSVLLQQVLAERLNDAAVARYYEENVLRFHREEVHARHLLVRTEDEARKLLGALRGGADFTKLAAEHSLDPGSAETGGDLGWFPADAMVEPFAQAAFAAQPGEIAGPVQTQYGWHLIEVLGKRDRIPLEEAAAGIRAELQPRILQDYVDELKRGADIRRGSPRVFATPIAVGPTVPAWKGGKEPPITLVAFIDLQCPHCHEMHLAIQKLLAARADVRVVYRHYPLEKTCNPHVERGGRVLACESARAVVCAEGNPALYADLLNNGDVLDRAAIAAAGPRHGVSARKWGTCLEAPETAARVAADVAEGAALGIEGTPTVYLRAHGAWSKLEVAPEELADAVAQAAG